jgi:hypothetical protein
MSWRMHTSKGELRCRSDIKRNGYWTGKQCPYAATWTVDGKPLCGTHKAQRARWSLAADRDVVIERIDEHDGVIQRRATIGP